jgi:hypothetical protein
VFMFHHRRETKGCLKVADRAFPRAAGIEKQQ